MLGLIRALGNIMNWIVISIITTLLSGSQSYAKSCSGLFTRFHKYAAIDGYQGPGANKYSKRYKKIDFNEPSSEQAEKHGEDPLKHDRVETTQVNLQLNKIGKKPWTKKNSKERIREYLRILAVKYGVDQEIILSNIVLVRWFKGILESLKLTAAEKLEFLSESLEGLAEALFRRIDGEAPNVSTLRSGFFCSHR